MSSRSEHTRGRAAQRSASTDHAGVDPQESPSRRAFLQKFGGAVLGVALAGFGGLSYARELETEWIELCRLRLELPRLSPEFGGYRLVHISDLHLDDRTSPEYVNEVVRLVNGEGPDLICVTGDFVTFSPERFAGRLAAGLGRLSAADGVFAVLGNHDYRAGPDVVRAALDEAGVRCLDNEAHTLERNGAPLHVCGIEDVWEGRPRLGRVVGSLPRKGAAILLAHEPDFADVSTLSDRFELQLSGHSHGGQVRLPFVGAPWLPRYARKYPGGLYRVGDMLLYTNRGLGMLPPRVRFRCRPEITTLTLSSAQR